ncbi:hypothetical protein OSB04_016877 [Centaurea solstitialis]|uniref:Uncharacterized protein n=1 Tax=Centaurea solstitialis TaxID=347529 RepID=A0AA38W8X7_9ASTR|nr:hypothetical protein OSB04_016877 [Centaurea solstitialis]
MEALPKYWETYTMCLKLSKDIKTITSLLRPDEMIMILNLYLVNSNQDQDQETNESGLQSTDPVH